MVQGTCQIFYKVIFLPYQGSFIYESRGKISPLKIGLYGSGKKCRQHVETSAQSDIIKGVLGLTCSATY